SSDCLPLASVLRRLIAKPRQPAIGASILQNRRASSSFVYTLSRVGIVTILPNEKNGKGSDDTPRHNIVAICPDSDKSDVVIFQTGQYSTASKCNNTEYLKAARPCRTAQDGHLPLAQVKCYSRYVRDVWRQEWDGDLLHFCLIFCWEQSSAGLIIFWSARRCSGPGRCPAKPKATCRATKRLPHQIYNLPAQSASTRRRMPCGPGSRRWAASTPGFTASIT